MACELIELPGYGLTDSGERPVYGIDPEKVIMTTQLTIPDGEEMVGVCELIVEGKSEPVLVLDPDKDVLKRINVLRKGKR